MYMILQWNKQVSICYLEYKCYPNTKLDMCIYIKKWISCPVWCLDRCKNMHRPFLLCKFPYNTKWHSPDLGVYTISLSKVCVCIHCVVAAVATATCGLPRWVWVFVPAAEVLGVGDRELSARCFCPDAGWCSRGLHVGTCSCSSTCSLRYSRNFHYPISATICVTNSWITTWWGRSQVLITGTVSSHLTTL